jgi:hypothetical protein
MPKEVFIKYDASGQIIPSFKRMLLAAIFIEHKIKLRTFKISQLNEDIPKYLLIQEKLRLIDSKSKYDYDIPAETFHRIAQEL